MAATSELERLQIRKARLIKQNDTFRRDLLAEADSLRDAAGLIERGHSFYEAASRLGNWPPFAMFRRRKKQSSIAKIVKGCAVGFRLLRGLMTQSSDAGYPDESKAKHFRLKQRQPDCEPSIKRF